MLASIILSSLLILVDVRKVYSVPPEACFAPFRWDDCGKEPKPVMYYWKPGSRCEVGMWRGCLPNINMFPDEYECVATCIFSMRAGMEDYHSFNELEKDSDETTRDPYDIYYKDTTLTDELNDTAANDTDVSEGGTIEGGEDGNTTTEADAGGTNDTKKPDDSKADGDKPGGDTPKDGETTTKSGDGSEGAKPAVTLTPSRKSVEVGKPLEKQEITFTCTDCKIEAGDITCNNGLGAKVEVTPAVVETKIELDFGEAAATFADAMACVCMGKFKSASDDKIVVDKVLAVIDNADITAVTEVKKLTETSLGETKEFAVEFTCEDCTDVDGVTENGIALTKETGYKFEKGKLTITITQEAKDFEGAYQAVFKTDAASFTKTVLEIGLPAAAK